MRGSRIKLASGVWNTGPFDETIRPGIYGAGWLRSLGNVNFIVKCEEAGIEIDGPADGRDAPSVERTHQFTYQLYMKHRESMRGFFTRVLNRPEDISDAMQELYVRLARQKDLEKKCRNPKAYLFRTATNMLNDSLRKKYSRSLQLHVPVEQVAIEAADPTPEESASMGQQLGLVRQACAKLSDGEREAFFMHRLNNMTYREIAAELGVSERTVRRWVVQALSCFQEAVAAQS